MTDHTLTTAVSVILQAARPASIPPSIPIVIESTRVPLTRPLFVVRANEGRDLHPKMRQLNIILELRTHADEQEPEFASAWHAAAAQWLTDNPASLHATLATENLRLHRFTPGLPTDEPEGRRGRTYSQTWTAIIES